MSLSLGVHPRVGFSLLAVGALLVMAHFYRRTEPGGRQAAAGLALIAAGAMGNLLDRLRSARGVVDFIDVGLGSWRLWTFNFADVSILVGAVVLLLALRRMEGAEVTPLSRP
jgi:signal peptidase II